MKKEMYLKTLSLVKQNKNIILALVFLAFALTVLSVLAYYVFWGYKNNFIGQSDNVAKISNQFNEYKENTSSNNLTEFENKVFSNFISKNENVLTTLKYDYVNSLNLNKFENNALLTKVSYEQKLGPKKCKLDMFRDNDVFLSSKANSLLFRNNDHYLYKLTYTHPELGVFYNQIQIENYKDKLLENIYYNGGDYAVKSVENKYAVDNSNNDNLEINIPGNVQIINNDNFYIIRFIKNNVDCNKGMVSASNPNSQNVIEDFYLDKNTYQVVKQFVYLDAVDDKNLIKEVVVTVLTKESKFEDVRDLFNLDANVTVKKLNAVNNDQMDFYEKRKNVFDNLDISFIRPINGNVEVVYAYVNIDSSDIDREFFPKGKLGDELYSSYNTVNDYIYNSKLKFSYILDVDKKIAWDVSVYSSFKSIDEYLSGTSKENIYKFNKNFSGKNLEVARVKFNTIDGPQKYRYVILYNGYIYDFDMYDQNDGSRFEDISKYDIGIFDKGTKEFNLLKDFVHNVKMYRKE